MKSKYIIGLLSLCGAVFTACNDDDMTIYTDPVVDASSVSTGSADVTSTSATLYGSVKGLDDRSSNSYRTGFNYTTSNGELQNVSAADLKLSVNAPITDGQISATLSDLMPGTVVYYQAFVTLSSTLTFTGEVKSLVTTDAKVEAAPVTNVNAFSTNIDCSFDNAPEGAVMGVTLSPDSDVESVRSGLHIASDNELATRGNASVEVKGLVPSTTYYYAAYMNVGPGEVYSDVRSFTTPSYDFDLDNDLVDLGLPSGLKWAKYNVGTTSESDFGGLYAFGDATGVMNSIDPENYATGVDIAKLAYQNKATLPSAEDWEELFNNCSLDWTTVDGNTGFKVTGPNGNSIFLPAQGSRIMNEVSDAGVKGYYLSSTAGSDSKYYTAYSFTGNQNYGRTVLPVYQAVAARAVSTSRDVKLVEEYLLNTWEFDYADGMSQHFDGPVYFYGTDDSWDSLTNGIPVDGDSWAWEADASNNWIWGDDANMQGSMTFSIDENGNRKVEVKQYADGTFTTSTGTYTLDKENKTITLEGCEILVPANYLGDATQSRSNKVKILSLTADGLQLGVVRTEDPCLLGMNYIPQLQKYGYTAKLTCYADWNDDHWNEVGTLTIPSGETGLGEHTIVLNTTNPRNTAFVYVIDLEGYANDYPNALITVESIKADGEEIPFDANKLFYGNIEGNGNYRIELANIWGCGHNDAWNGLADTPFRPEGGEVEGEDKLAFNSSFEVTINIRSLDAAVTYYPTLVTINPEWGGSWDWNDGSNFSISLNNETHKWEVSQPAQSITITTDNSGSDMSTGSIMTFVQINNLYAHFPGMHAVLKDVKIDGTSLTGYDANKVLDQNGDGDGKTYRLELYNTYGATKGDCAFAPIVDDYYVPALGFSNSMQVDYSIERLFSIPDWN